MRRIILVLLLAGCMGQAIDDPALESTPDPGSSLAPTSDPGSSPDATPTSDPTTEPPPDDPAPNKTAQNSTSSTRLLEVSVFDYTSGILSAPRAVEVEVKRFGSWKPDLSYGSAGPKAMGRHVVGELATDGLKVFPDGREAVECSVDLQITATMEDERHEDITQIEIYDQEVWIFGSAVPGHANAETAFVCRR